MSTSRHTPKNLPRTILTLVLGGKLVTHRSPLPVGTTLSLTSYPGRAPKECNFTGCPEIVIPIPLETQRAHVAELSSEALTAESITPEAAASFFHFITCDELEHVVVGWVVRHRWLANLRDAGGRVPVAVASPAIKVAQRRAFGGLNEHCTDSVLVVSSDVVSKCYIRVDT